MVDTEHGQGSVVKFKGSIHYLIRLSECCHLVSQTDPGHGEGMDAGSLLSRDRMDFLMPGWCFVVN